MSNENPFGAPAAADDSFEVELGVDEGYRKPKGKYPARIVNLDKAVSQAGNNMWTWEFALLGGKHAGQTVKMWTALTPAAMWKLRETLEALGLGQAGQKSAFKRSDAIGKECVIELEDSEYQGQKSSSINKVLPAGTKVDFEKTLNAHADAKTF